MNTLTSPAGIGQRLWWTSLFQGIIALVVGVCALAWPGKTAEFIIYLFGIYVLLASCMALVIALMQRRTTHRWWLSLVVGCIGIVLAIALFNRPGAAALLFLDLIAIWTVFAGMVQILLMIIDRERASSGWFSLLVAVLTIILGLFLVARPYVGLLVLIYALGIIQLCNGMFYLLRAHRLRMGGLE